MKPNTSRTNYKYLFIIVDKYSYYPIIKLLKKKLYALDTLIKIINLSKAIHSLSRFYKIQAG